MATALVKSKAHWRPVFITSSSLLNGVMESANFVFIAAKVQKKAIKHAEL